MNDLTPEQTDRLESAHAAFGRPDGVARARLLAALAAEGPPRSNTPWNAGFAMLSRNKFRLATAAALVLGAVGLGKLAEPKGALAQTVRAMAEARGYSCDLVLLGPAADAAKDRARHGRLYWSSTGEERAEWLEKGRMKSVDVRRPGKTGLDLLPESKQFRVTPPAQSREFSFELFGRLGTFRGDAGPPAGVEEIGGKKVEEYVLPWARTVGDDSHPDARMRVWIDPTTRLPARVDVIGIGPNDEAFRFDNFAWGPQDPKLFEVTVPEGYTRLPVVDAKLDQITEYVTNGLRTFAKYNQGKYPAVTYVYGDEQGQALRKLMGMGPKAMSGVVPDKTLKWDDPKDEEFAYGTYGLTWINGLQRERPEFVYRGKSVGPNDAGKVLIRWKLDDDQYRVLFGDLKAETVPADRLKELEAR